MSHVICRKDRVRFLAGPHWQGGWHETVSGGAGSWGARGAGGDHAQGLTSFAEGAQRAGSAQLRRGRVQRAARDRPGDRRGVADQRAQGGSGQEAVCGGRSGSGAWGPAGSSSEIPSQGGRGIRGAPRRAQLRRSARGALAVVAAPAGGPRGGTRLHRQRLARDGAARAKKKRRQTVAARRLGDPRRSATPTSRRGWSGCSTSTGVRTMRISRWCAWTRRRAS